MSGRREPRRFSPAHAAVLAILLQPLVWAGPGGRYPWMAWGWEGAGAAVWALVAVGFLLAGRALATCLDERRALLEKLAAGLLLAAPALSAVFDLLGWRHFARFGYRFPLPLLILDGALVPALYLWLKRGRPAGTGALIAALGATAHRALAILVCPLDGRRSDMLTSILHGHVLWSQGLSPYSQTPSLDSGPASWGIMPYLPGTFLAHAPSVWMGLDPRWLGAFLVFVLGAVSAYVLREARHGFSAPSELAIAELLAALVLLSPYQAFRHELYFDAFLVITAALFFWIARCGPLSARGLVASGALVGLACATRQWAWVYAPFTLIAASAPGRHAPLVLVRRLALAGTAAAAAFLLVVVPFVTPDPAAFFGAVLHHLSAPGGELSLGVALAAGRLGLAGWLPWVQASLVAAALTAVLIAAGRGRSHPMEILAIGWAVLFAVIVLSPFLEDYFYLTPSFAAVGLALGSATRSITPTASSTAAGSPASTSADRP